MSRIDFSARKGWLVLVSLIFITLLHPWLRGLQTHLDDRIMRWSRQKQFASPVSVLYFDDQAIAQLGGWPLPRNIYAWLIQTVAAQGARAIAFDVFWDPGTVSKDENDQALQHMLA